MVTLRTQLVKVWQTVQTSSLELLKTYLAILIFINGSKDRADNLVGLPLMLFVIL